MRRRSNDTRSLFVMAVEVPVSASLQALFKALMGVQTCGRSGVFGRQMGLTKRGHNVDPLQLCQ
jgi:hypothetical protein